MPACRRSFLLVWVALGLGAPLRAGAADSPRDSTADSVRVVRTLEETIVRAARLDALSGATTLRITRESIRRLPADGLAQVLAVQPGLVVDGDLVYVRGARPG